MACSAVCDDIACDSKVNGLTCREQCEIEGCETHDGTGGLRCTRCGAMGEDEMIEEPIVVR